VVGEGQHQVERSAAARHLWGAACDARLARTEGERLADIPRREPPDGGSGVVLHRADRGADRRRAVQIPRHRVERVAPAGHLEGEGPASGPNPPGHRLAVSGRRGQVDLERARGEDLHLRQVPDDLDGEVA
jgi:hypothetical protein